MANGKPGFVSNPSREKSIWPTGQSLIQESPKEGESKTQFVKVDGLQVNHVEFVLGEIVVFLHGLSGWQEDWIEQIGAPGIVLRCAIYSSTHSLPIDGLC